MLKFTKLDKNCSALLKDITKKYISSNFYTPEASSKFAQKYIGLDPTIPDSFSEKTIKELNLLAQLGYIEDINSPVPTQYGLKYHHYKKWYYLEKFVIPTILSFIVSLAINLIFNYDKVSHTLTSLIDFILNIY